MRPIPLKQAKSENGHKGPEFGKTSFDVFCPFRMMCAGACRRPFIATSSILHEFFIRNARSCPQARPKQFKAENGPNGPEFGQIWLPNFKFRQTLATLASAPSHRPPPDQLIMNKSFVTHLCLRTAGGSRSDPPAVLREITSELINYS